MLIKFKSLLVFSERNKRYFYTTFIDGVNIVKGKNTSGKSTLIQSVIYSLGINDGNEKLQEILDQQLTFRLELEKIVDTKKFTYTFIRDGQSFYIYENNSNPLRFDGINSDNSIEHIKLKKIISSIFGFHLALESKEELKEAPLEVMLLPYYISQSVGWVYLRESFSGLHFYKDFKSDYLDYYLGITNNIDRIELHKLIRQKSEIAQEIKFLDEMKKTNEYLQVSQLEDEEFKVEATKYLSEYSQLRENLIKEETHHIHLCNQKSLASNRQVVLQKIKRNISKQRPELDACPVCTQKLPNSLAAYYSHEQNINDTDNEISLVKEKIVETQSKINSAFNKIKKFSAAVEQKYSVVKNYISHNSNITFDTWLDNKSNIKLLGNIDKSISDKSSLLADVEGKIKNIFTDEDLENKRAEKEQVFLGYFNVFLSELSISGFDQPHYKQLYKINFFPRQGVELHKTVMAYHFALNKLIASTPGIHRFPFILDAVMKEDIDEDNRRKIFSFINKFYPKDTQIIFSVSESLSLSKGDNTSTKNIDLVNKEYFMGRANVIQIGDGDSERCFLTEYDGKFDELIESTLKMTSVA